MQGEGRFYLARAQHVPDSLSFPSTRGNAMTTATFNIGKVVRAMREGAGISTADLARVTGIRRPSIEAIEKGRATTPTERHDLACGFAWIANNGIKS